MKKGKEIVFGDKRTFGIRYVPSYSVKSRDDFAYCHLMLGGQIIGRKQETCYLKSWKSSIEWLRDQLRDDLDSIRNTEFKDKTNEELFELIRKVNQLEEDHNIDFSHLPVLDTEVWGKCVIRIDETIDSYFITMIESDGRIKFLWRGWREPCPAEKIGKLFSITVDRLFVVDTLEKCLKQIEEDYVGLRQVAKG